MVNWQVTATTIYCDAIDDDVTLIVDKDWNVQCTGFKKYSADLDKATARALKQRSRKLGKNLKCEGPLDYRVTDYRDKLKAQEKPRP
ncbi:MAG: hypothetical protein ABR958_00555 [Dehalococcoidales bacterium]